MKEKPRFHDRQVQVGYETVLGVHKDYMEAYDYYEKHGRLPEGYVWEESQWPCPKRDHASCGCEDGWVVSRDIMYAPPD